MANVWIFQSNPKIYDLRTELDDPTCKEANWTVRQYKDKIKKGDIALHWISGKNRGIYAIVHYALHVPYHQMSLLMLVCEKRLLPAPYRE